MWVLVNWQTSVKLFSFLSARFMAFLVLSLVCFFSPTCSWSVPIRCGCSTLLICKYLRICQVMIAAFSRLHAADTKSIYFTLRILSHLIQLPWPVYQKLYMNVAGATAELLCYYAFNGNNLSVPMTVLSRLFLCTWFHSLNLKCSVLVFQAHSTLFSSLVNSMCTCISAVGHELVKR